MTDNRKLPWRPCLFALAWFALVAACGGCASVENADALLRVEATVQRNEVALEDVNIKLGNIGLTVGNIDATVSTQIGGDGDSITSWLLVGGIVLIVLGLIAAALFYPLVLRPRRKRRELESRLGSGNGEGDEQPSAPQAI